MKAMERLVFVTYLSAVGILQNSYTKFELLRVKVYTSPAYLGNLCKCRVILLNACNICSAASEGRGEEHYVREIHYDGTQQSVEHSVKPFIRYTARNVVIF